MKILLWQLSFAQKLKNCPSKSVDDCQNSSNLGFHSRKLSSGQVDISFEYPAENICRFPKIFCSFNCEKLNVLSVFLFFRRSSGHVEFSFDKLDEKLLPNVVFLWSKFQISFEKRLFRIKTSKISSRNVDWSAVLTTLAKNAHQKSGNFSIELGKDRFTAFKFICSRKSSFGIVGSDFANPAEKSPLMSENFFSQIP